MNKKRAKYFTAEQIYKTKKVGDLVILKNSLIEDPYHSNDDFIIEAEIVEMDKIEHVAEGFFGAHNVYQDIKTIKFLYGNAQTLQISSHNGIEGKTIVGGIVFSKNPQWDEYLFSCAQIKSHNLKIDYIKYMKDCYYGEIVTKRELINYLQECCYDKVITKKEFKKELEEIDPFNKYELF